MAHSTNSPPYNYDLLGHNYSGYRQTDPRIAEYVHKALGEVKTVLNVGAGAGSYEPTDRYVVAVEPSKVMRQQRLATGRPPAVDAKADNLPFDDNAFDASMALVTVHHWPDIDLGLKEMRRVTKGPVVIMTFDPEEWDNFWTAEYFPELDAVERTRFPKIEKLKEYLGGSCEEISIPIPLDCKDLFREALYGRPEAFLDKNIRAAQSAWAFLPAGMEEKLVKRLADELASGEWDRKYGHFRNQPTFTCALKLVVGS